MLNLEKILHFTIGNAEIIFAIGLLLIIGRYLDKFIKKNSRIKFSRNFLQKEKINYLDASKNSLYVLDYVFSSKKTLGLILPRFSRIFIASVIISGSIMGLYMLLFLDKIAIGQLIVRGEPLKQPILMFSISQNNTEFILLYLIPILLFFVNPVLDFFSYGQTRFFLDVLVRLLEKSENHHLIKIAVFCFLDLLYSFLLFGIFIFGARALYYLFSFEPRQSTVEPISFLETLKETAGEPFRLVNSYFSGLGIDGIYGGILISTFISTLFVWYIFGSYMLTYLQKYFEKILKLISEHSHLIRVFYRKPFTVISYLFAFFAFIIGITLKSVT